MASKTAAVKASKTGARRGHNFNYGHTYNSQYVTRLVSDTAFRNDGQRCVRIAIPMNKPNITHKT